MSESEAATRVWAAGEALKKAGVRTKPPLMLTTMTADGWILLQAGPFRIATWCFQLLDHADALVLALLVKGASGSDESVREESAREK